MIDLILATALVLETVLFGAVFFVTGRANARERKELLDRVMSRNWAEYKSFSGEPVKSNRRQVQVIDDEDEANYAEKHGYYEAVVPPMTPEEEEQYERVGT